MPKKLSVCHDAAYLDYLRMGMDRSLVKLHEKYTATTPDFPSLDTLKRWSRRYRWQHRISQDDLEVGAKVRDAVMQQKGDQLVAIQAQLRDSARKILYDMLMELCSKRTRTLEESQATYYQMKTSIEMVHLAEALPGGCFYDLIPQDWPQRKKFLAAMKLPKHLSEDLKQHLK